MYLLSKSITNLESGYSSYSFFSSTNDPCGPNGISKSYRVVKQWLILPTKHLKSEISAIYFHCTLKYE